MRQLKFKGFTLIELLIVVAIIAILAAIAVPNFLEAQIRSKVSRAKTDMRTLATALEAYFVDANMYVGSSSDTTQAGKSVNSMLKPVPSATAGAITGATSPSNASGRITFDTYRPQTTPDGLAQTLTTPIAYLTSLPADPFADTKGAAFGYFNAADAGWITWSYGPDTDEATYNGQIQRQLWDPANWDEANARMDFTKCSIYNPYTTNPSLVLKVSGNAGGSFTYDPTNGTSSSGDVWRVKD